MPLERICFTLQVKKDRIEEYRSRHQTVWPEMLEALSQTGWHNYSLFLSESGMLVGYLETPDFGKALAGMAAREVNARWQREMTGFFEIDPNLRPDEVMRPLSPIFHLP